MTSEVDVVISFRAFPRHSLSKQQTREEARKAEQQYSRLIDTLTYSGLRAVGRRGETLGHILVFVTCPDKTLKTLRAREGFNEQLAPADRLRLIYEYITATPRDGGLGIVPGSTEWNLVESVMLLHDKKFNETWIFSFKTRSAVSGQLRTIRDQFGDSTALYFAFLKAYTRSLAFPAALGLVFYLLNKPYHPVYALGILLYSTIFTEYWRVNERVLSGRFYPPTAFSGSPSATSMSTASLAHEKQLLGHTPGLAWWKRDLRILSSIPIILLFAAVLVSLLTGIFVFEAFVTHLYTGPGEKLISFAPTLLFILLVPRFLAVYHRFATSLTTWENHTAQSPTSISSNTYHNAQLTARAKQAHTASLTLKTFILNAFVAYLGLGLSAFVYVPFGEEVMHAVQQWVGSVRVDSSFGWVAERLRAMGLNETLAHGVHARNVVSEATGAKQAGALWEMDATHARKKLNPSRLRDQMFAFTVTNQVVNTFMEIGLPFVLRFIERLQTKKKPAAAATNSPGLSQKKVVFEDERLPADLSPDDAKWEADVLKQARQEVKLPEYDVFADYSEMVIQFGYVAIWSSIWSLAPVMAFLNNILEQRSDAFKIAVHARRPIPQRTQTIGPWLDALTFLTWLGSLVNAALVYMFGLGSSFGTDQTIAEPQVDIKTDAATHGGMSGSVIAEKQGVLLTALLLALVASHGYLALRMIVARVMERVLLGGEEAANYENQTSAARADVDDTEGDEKEEWKGNVLNKAEKVELDASTRVFWTRDEGPEEIARILKEA
ncbi:hypothetical protein HGRIS_004168 [Hohenbuehelia grisea]|uniref:DUF590-domain-containing protein n=1 Tax=Hohenbuehelia grisea TaxID=104357 RepID=A0ABR3JHN8_9AGAR